MNSISKTTRFSGLLAVAGLGILLSACGNGSSSSMELADSLPKGDQALSQVNPSVGAEVAQAGTVSSQAPGQSQDAEVMEQAAQAAAPAQSVVTTAPTASVTVTTPVATVSTQATGRVSLSWTPPTENTDGSQIANLAGYRVYYGSSASALTNKVEISNAGLTAYVLENLPKGTTYFAVAAYNAAGVESSLSGVGSKTIS